MADAAEDAPRGTPDALRVDRAGGSERDAAGSAERRREREDVGGLPPEACPLLVAARPVIGLPNDGDGNPPAAAHRPVLGSSDPIHAEPGNRCGASDPPLVLSLAQQRLVCFDAAHVDCPRYARALGPGRTGAPRAGRPDVPPAAVAAVAGIASAPVKATAAPPAEASAPVKAAAARPAETAAAPPAAIPRGSAETTIPGPPGVEGIPLTPVAPAIRSRRRSGARPAGARPTPLVVASGLLVVAAIVALAFVSLRGGLELPSASPSLPTAVIPSSGASATAESTPAATPNPTPSPTSSPSPSLTPGPTPSASINPTPSPTASLPAAFQGLKPCPDRAGCYLYRVRSGDSLTSIAAKFGVTLQALKTENPELKDPSLIHVGDVLRIPLPPA